MKILTFNELKESVVINKNKKYFSNEDLNYWSTETSLVFGVKKDDYIIILDNNKFEEGYNRNFKIKYYDILDKKINTLFANNDIYICYKYISNILNSDITQDILNTGEIEKNKIISLYHKKEAVINLTPYEILNKLDKNQLIELKKWINKRESVIQTYKYLNNPKNEKIIKILMNLHFINHSFNSICNKILELEV